MFNGSRFNGFGFNSNTAASIAIVFAEATFSTAGATTSFEGGGYVYSADANLTASATLPAFDVLYTAYPIVDLESNSYLYGVPETTIQISTNLIQVIGNITILLL